MIAPTSGFRESATIPAALTGAEARCLVLNVMAAFLAVADDATVERLDRVNKGATADRIIALLRHTGDWPFPPPLAPVERAPVAESVEAPE